MATTTSSNPIVERCIEDCLECVHWCSACVDESLTHDPAKMAKSIRLCHECAPVCSACAILLSGNSRFGPELCLVCADICDACATECEKHKHMEIMRRCAESCRRCAKSCREVGKSGPIPKTA